MGTAIELTSTAYMHSSYQSFTNFAVCASMSTVPQGTKRVASIGWVEI